MFVLPVTMLAAIIVSSADAEVTPEQSQELRSLRSDVAKVSSMLRKKQFDEAKQALDAAEEQVKEIMSAAEVEANDRRLQGLPQLIAARRKALLLQMGQAGGGATATGVSFVDDVAPIIADNCLGCHGSDNPRANLSLDTFAGWKRGGQSGRLLTVGNPNASRLLAKLITPNANLRMPKGENPLPRSEINLIARWVSEGAKFDGDSETTALDRLNKPKAAMNVTIPKPQGTETVSFTKDIAPMIVRLCIRCHSGNTPASGLSLETFADLMIGGDSGEVIIPGDKENSRLFRLVGGLEPPRMPQGQARIRRSEYADLVIWFEEGNTYDGDDPQARLVDYVPTEADLAAQRFAAMSADEFIAHRKQQAESLWKRTLPNDPFQTVETEQFLIIGDVPEARLKEVETWATAQLEKLKQTFNVNEEPIWKGRLAILVFNERFGMTEYAMSILGTPAPEGMYGNSVVTASHSDAYVVLQDVGDSPDAQHPGLHANLVDHLTGAFLQRKGPLADWIVRGAGLQMAAQATTGNPYIRSLPKQALAAVGSMNRPRDLFEAGTFSPATVGAVGYSLVEYLTTASGNARFAQLIGRVQSGAETADAIQTVYGTTPDTLGQSFLTALRRAVN